MKKEKIMQIAQELFLKKGFSNVPVEEITKAVGISKGSFYTYFNSKDNLLKEIASSSIDAIKTELIMKSKKTADPVQVLDNFLKTNINLSKKYISGIAIAVRELSFADVKNNELSTLIDDKIRDTLKDLIVSLKGNCSQEDILLLWGIMLSVWIQSGIEGKRINTKKLATKIWIGIGDEQI